ncbi:MAG: EF-P lysine aminoacylase GenX [Alphaproteobacteria bacterium]|nr:EF-P lysine aminoacylase GenX [Alphaproteobacteria bacterium]
MQEWWRPAHFASRRAALERRERIRTAVRSFFAERKFAEVETPALQVSPGLEPHLRAFATELHDQGEVGFALRYLHTSPELAMKKLLVAGMPRIWQLAHVFRDSERSATHHPEFSMLEWYRAGASYRDLMDECTALVRICQNAADAAALTWRGHTADAMREWQRISVAEAFDRHCGLDLLSTAPDPLHPDTDRLAAAASGIGIAPHPGDDWETLFFRIFLECIEPRLGLGAPTILYDYPLSMAALARGHRDDPRLAERFEVYICGLELANGFGELTDAAEQRARFLADQSRKQQLYGQTYPIDEDFLAALEYGLPDCAGIALGFDRLVMLASGAGDIEEVLWAPVL